VNHSYPRTEIVQMFGSVSLLLIDELICCC
jgi:hypothetical protein